MTDVAKPKGPLVFMELQGQASSKQLQLKFCKDLEGKSFKDLISLNIGYEFFCFNDSTHEPHK